MFHKIIDMAIDSQSTRLFVTDYFNNAIRLVQLGQPHYPVTTVTIKINGPWGIAIDGSDSTLYVSSNADCKIWKLTLSSFIAIPLVGTG